MAAGDRYENGKPKDVVRHARKGGQHPEGRESMCGRKDPDYVTDDMTDITCLKCIQRRRKAVENILSKAIFLTHE